jgi:hypothetical protein
VSSCDEPASADTIKVNKKCALTLYFCKTEAAVLHEKIQPTKKLNKTAKRWGNISARKNN